jgi:hypothetical protein
LIAGTAQIYRATTAPVAKAEDKATDKPEEDPVVASAFDKEAKTADLVQLLKELPPEQAAYYVAKLEAAYKKRKLQFTGYLVALVAWLVAMLLALGYYGANEGFTGWVFLVPFTILGLVLFAFGRWAELVGNSVGPPPESASQPAPAKSKAKSKSKV